MKKKNSRAKATT